MHLEKLSIVNFRNYTETQAVFSPDLNLIYGLNAQGKTNFLEAIYLVCLGRSFRVAKNQELVKKNSSFFTIEGSLTLDNQIKKKAVLRYIKDGKKEISIDRKKLTKHSKIFGQFPIVVMAPDELKITSGGPSERRRFIDIFLSQVSLSYLTNLQEYNRILKQRNRILQQIRDGQGVSEMSMQPWTQRLVEVGCEIINSRNKFIQEFSEKLQSIYKKYTESQDTLKIFIESTVTSRKELCETEDFYNALGSVKKKERILGTTLVGPHRDDLIFQINGMDLRKYGSRGEHKSVLVALKIAEFRYLKSNQDETPIMLLDDCYSELDNLREEKVFNSLNDLGQIFMTSPKESILENQRGQSEKFSNVSEFYIESGNIEYKNN
ncbi:DNA replication/repair protein RecF [candidate division KSB1 bacterium]|nr:DNA replication/repair protein RecF [candidate division KSB1 bacterium]